MTQTELLEMTQWAMDNDCLDPHETVLDCDDCGRRTCRGTAYIWSDTLVICTSCKPSKEA